MNPGRDPETELHAGNAGRDNDEIWNQVPRRLQAAICAVDKKSYYGSSYITSDRLFLTSYPEHIATNIPTTDWRVPLLADGECYEYYKHTNTRGGDTSNSSLVKYQTSADGAEASTAWHWWTRSCRINEPNGFLTISPNGSTYGSAVDTQLLGVAPAFCL